MESWRLDKAGLVTASDETNTCHCALTNSTVNDSFFGQGDINTNFIHVVDMASWQASVNRFCYQYLQLEAEPSLPPSQFLKLSDAQEAIYEGAFADSVRHAPPQRYQQRVLKALVAAIEESIDDWEEYVSRFTTAHDTTKRHGNTSRYSQIHGP